MKTRQFIIPVMILLLLLTEDVTGLEKSHLVPLTALLHHRLNTSSSIETENLRSIGVHLPDVSCSVNNPCSRFDELLDCIDGQCSCIQPYCWVYHYESSGWTSSYVFSCGECGQLGSSCNETLMCDAPGNCWSDGYCHCPQGEHNDGICVATDQSWTYKFALGGFGMILFIGFVIVAYHFFKTRPWQQPGRWCCGLFKKRRGLMGRRGSCEKSPAFTIQSHYASQFSNLESELSGMSTDMPDELNPDTTRHHNQIRAQASNETSSARSFTSSETGTTVLDDTSIQSSSELTCDDFSEGACALPINTNPSQSVVVEDTHTKRPTSPKPRNNNTSENSSVSSSGSCTHERCKLCLPKGLSTRDNNNRPFYSGSNESSSSSVSLENVSLNDIYKVDMRGDTSSLSVEYECTKL